MQRSGPHLQAATSQGKGGCFLFWFSLKSKGIFLEPHPSKPLFSLIAQWVHRWVNLWWGDSICWVLRFEFGNPAMMRGWDPDDQLRWMRLGLGVEAIVTAEMTVTPGNLLSYQWAHDTSLQVWGRRSRSSLGYKWCHENCPYVHLFHPSSPLPSRVV